MNRLGWFLLSLLAVGSVTLTAHAQSAVPICSFDASGTNGAYPEADLALGPDGNFYGTTESGGATTNGTIFKVTTNGNLTALVNFNGTNGANPLDALTLGPDGNFYGTTEYGGNTIGITTLNAGLGGGTVFRVTTNGTLTTLFNFAGTNGSSPHGGLAWGPDGNLYGTTATGGTNGLPYGTVFRVTTNGTLTTLTNFNNSNGANPYAGLTLGPDGIFYGTTQAGGANNSGTVFKVTTNAILTTLYVFGTTNGISPETSLTLGPDGNFYGTTMQSYYTLYTVFPGYTINIPSGGGTIYQITTNGAPTVLVDFDYYSGTYPNASLTLGADGNFYGGTYLGGDNNLGTIFQVTTNGMLTTLVNLNNTNGAYPIGGVIFGPDNQLYGTGSSGGAGGNGTVFAYALPPYPIALAGSGSGSYTVFAGSYPDTTNRIWATTNLAAPASWQVLGTITTDANGLGQLLDTDTTNIPAKFYRLSYP
jgi:uncharacterized repeat protein (TIGR03803 family)